MAGGLFDPLGTDRPDRAAPRFSAPVIAVALALAALSALFAAAWLRDDGDRGRPIAVAPIERVEAPPRPIPPPAPPAPPVAVPPGLPPVGADQDVEVQNGVRIVRPRRGTPLASPPGPGAPPDVGRTIAVPPAR